MHGSVFRRAAIGGIGLIALTVSSAGFAAAQPSAYAAPAPLADRSNAGPTSETQGCCRIPVGTPVSIQLVTAVGTQEAHSGDTFPIRLAAPVIVDGQVVLPVGTPGVGRVVQAAKPGMGGKGGKLVVSAEYLTVRDGALPLRALRLAAIGKDQSMEANMASVGGLVFLPLGMIGFAVKGGDIEIPAGTAASAKIGLAIVLPPVTAAGPQDYALVKAMAPRPDHPPGAFVLPDPPAGMGQVVFFREHTLLGTAQWFNVRENGEALGRLNNGAFFIVPVAAGQQSFTAQTEPEFTDLLTLKIDPGETYFVEAVLTKGVLIGVPNLTPSDRTRFDALASKMQAVPAAKQAAAH